MLRNNRGFTLIEMVMVLLIISLITGSVLAGSQIINQVKIQNFIKELNNYNQAYKIFLDKYKYYPGDFTGARNLWGISETNGDGNRIIGDGDINNSENYQAFRHLFLAKILDKPYNGNGADGNKIGVNLPGVNFDQNILLTNNSLDLWSWDANSNYDKGNSLSLRGKNDNYVINVKDAYLVDKKMDDGKPYVGKIIGYSGNDGECSALSISNIVIATNPLDKQEYYLPNDAALCGFNFAIGSYKFE